MRYALLVVATLAAASADALTTLPAGYSLLEPLGPDFPAWMKAGGWASRRDAPSAWRISDGALRLISRRNSVLIGTERGFPIEAVSTPILRLKISIDEVPAGADLSRKSGDDSAFRLYVVFDEGGGLVKPPNTIAYAWTEKDAPGKTTKSAHFSNLYYVSIGSGTTPGRWIRTENDVVADHARLFPGANPAPRVKAVLLKCDSNDTGTSGSSRIASAMLVKRGSPP